MDIENLESWAIQPDVCRCCLSTSGAWDLTASYITDAGIKEVYCEMIQECFGITMSCLTEYGPSRLICTLCVGHLRDACGFRKQVLRAEEQFVEIMNRKEREPVKTELVCPVKASELTLQDDLLVSSRDDVKSENESLEREYVPSHNTSDDVKSLYVRGGNRIDDTICKKSERVRLKRKGHKIREKGKREKKRKKTDDDYDSDTPIARLTKSGLNAVAIKVDNCNDDLENMKDFADVDMNDGRSFDTGMSGPRYTERSNIVIKQVSERKRIILTCNIVLRDTTACPFRHHKSWFRCFYCSQDFMEINLLRDHNMRTHPNVDDELRTMKRYPRSLQIDISNLECRRCNLNLTDVDSMRRHFVDVHDKIIYSECIADYKVDCSPYTCHLCEREFHVFRTLTTHLNEHYANCICDVCGKSFLNTKRLKVHKRTHENGEYPCNECGRVFKTRTSKANHTESAHSKRQLKCQICYAPMKHYNDRIKHMSEVHNITHKFRCPMCPREYNIKHYLATHIRQTHGSKNKKCTECGMAFITNHGLKKHMLKHSGDKPFSCALCCKSYARSYTLREHMRSHENDRHIQQIT